MCQPRRRCARRGDVQWDDAFGLGLAYMHARHYSPALGRFIQPDPGRAEANPYEYAGVNPVTYQDPSGHYYYVRNWPLVRWAAYRAYARGRISHANYSRVYWYGLASYSRTMCYYKYRYGFSGGGSGCDECIQAVLRGYSYGCTAGTSIFCGVGCLAFTGPAVLACFVVCAVASQAGCEISSDNWFKNQYSPLYAKKVCQDIGGCPAGGSGGGF
jgi:RHS repeat-associated protein